MTFTATTVCPRCGVALRTGASRPRARRRSTWGRHAIETHAELGIRERSLLTDEMLAHERIVAEAET